MPPPGVKNLGRYGDRLKPCVSNLAFEPCTNRKSQKSSRGVSTKVLTPPSQRPKFFTPSG